MERGSSPSLETEEYRKLNGPSASYIARRLKVAPVVVVEALAALERAGVVVRHGKTLKVADALVVDTRSVPMKRLQAHWANVALSRAIEGDTDWFAYNVISVSSTDLEKVQAVLRAAYREVRGIVKSSSPCEEAALLTMQLVRWK